MKHKLSITLILIAIFFLSQLISLFVVSQYVNIHKSAKEQKISLNKNLYNASVVKEPMEVKNPNNSYWILIIPILLGTALILFLMRFKKGASFFKAWFFIVTIITLTMAFLPFIKKLFSLYPALLSYSGKAAFVLAFVLAIYKVYKHSILIHNLTELFIYAGLTVVVIPILNIYSASMLLILISLYDMYAVWKSRHMIKLAKFQSKSNVFAGLMIPYELKHNKKNKDMEIKTSKATADKHAKAEELHGKTAQTKEMPGHKATYETRTAILGGGDISFPMFFASAVLIFTGSYLKAFIVISTTTIALSALFFKGKQNKFYPAMPFISIGCFAGYILTLLF